LTITELPLGSVPESTSSVAAITTGPDNNIWFARTTTVTTTIGLYAYSFQRVITIDRVGLNGSVAELANIPDPSEFPSTFQITTGPDGNLWLSEPDVDTLARITPAGVLTSFNIQDSPSGLVTGPDDNLWFSGTTGGPNSYGVGLQGTPLIGRYALPSDANPNGVVTEFKVGLSGIPGPLIAGPDGNLWFSEGSAQKIGRITAQGIITEFPVPSLVFPGALDLTAGPDGNVWFTDSDVVGRITPSGDITEFPVPVDQPGPGLRGITTGPDGNLWFDENFANQIGHMDPNGKILDQLPISLKDTDVENIAAGPDDTVVFTEVSFDNPAQIGVVNLNSSTGSSTGTVPHQSGVINGISNTGSITGTVFQDFNRNGLLSSNKPGLPGKTVFLDLNHSGTLDAGDPVAVTDANGFYSFPAVPAGTYTLRQLVPPTYLQANPPALGSYTVTVVAGETQANLDFEDQAASAVLAVPAPQSLFGGSNPDPLTAFVRAQYLAILGREPETTGLTYWVTQLQGGMSRQQATEAIWNSNEQRGHEVDRYYQTFFQRAADPAGRAYWIQQLQSSMDETAVIQAFLTSQEYQTLHPDNASFVQGLYNDVLGRAGESSGVDYWQNLLQTCVGRAALAQGFLGSDEAHGVAVDTFFTMYLERADTTPEKVYWLNQFKSNALTYAGGALGILDSQEFFDRAASTVP
jgi:streptogramin lyase